MIVIIIMHDLYKNWFTRTRLPWFIGKLCKRGCYEIRVLIWFNYTLYVSGTSCNLLKCVSTIQVVSVFHNQLIYIKKAVELSISIMLLIMILQDDELVITRDMNFKFGLVDRRAM